MEVIPSPLPPGSPLLGGSCMGCRSIFAQRHAWSPASSRLGVPLRRRRRRPPARRRLPAPSPCQPRPMVHDAPLAAAAAAAPSRPPAPSSPPRRLPGAHSHPRRVGAGALGRPSSHQPVRRPLARRPHLTTLQHLRLARHAHWRQGGGGGADAAAGSTGQPQAAGDDDGTGQ
eukprot:scaffold2851_cov114-Isochrysis_galbana.AAC.3